MIPIVIKIINWFSNNIRIVAVVTISFQLNAGKNDLGSLMLENIDALASGETGTNIYCRGTGSVDCPINHVKVWAVMSR